MKSHSDVEEQLLAEGWEIFLELQRITEGLERSLDAIASQRKGEQDG